MSPVAPDPGTAARLRRNGVLGALTPGPGLLAELELVRLDQGSLVHEVGAPVGTVLFPLTCVVSVATREDDDALDVTTVGREGLVSLSGLLGAPVHDTLAVCRVAGEAWRLPVSTARELLVADPRGLAVLHQHIRGVVGDLMQRLACNRVHTNEQRCACWLLKTSDRVEHHAFRLTHATLATMLGVRRATVTDSLASLQRQEVVRSDHGTLTVLDRPALEAAACDCYRVFGQNFPIRSA